MGSFGSMLTDVNVLKSKVVGVCSCVHVSIFLVSSPNVGFLFFL